MGPYLVKTAGSFSAPNTTSVFTAGDGKGSENPVPVQTANQAVFLIDFNHPGGTFTRLQFYVEVTADAQNFYRETSYTETVVNGVYVRALDQKLYDALAVDYTASQDWRVALPVDVIAAGVRFSWGGYSTGGPTTLTNLAIRAMTGRV